MAEELNLDHFDLGTFVDYVYALKKERDALRAQKSSQGGEAVAWHTDDHLTDKSATTYDREVAERWRAKGWPVTTLYTHPADQVAEPDAELVELLQDASQWFADRDIDINLARDIDAKLASLEVSHENR